MKIVSDMGMGILTEMQKKDKYRKELKEICQEIGCSGIDPDMCKNNPEKCGIIRRIVMSWEVKTDYKGDENVSNK